MANEKRDFFVKIETIARGEGSNPSYRYVNDFPAALAYVKACCGETKITDIGNSWIELQSGETTYLATKEEIENYYDISDEYPGKF